MMKYSINNILAKVASDIALSDDEKTYLNQYLAVKEQRKMELAERRKMLSARRNASLHSSLLDIIKTYPNTPLTATEIQLMFPDAVRYHISSQMIARHLKMMANEQVINHETVRLYDDYFHTGKRTSVWFFGSIDEMEIHNFDFQEMNMNDPFGARRIGRYGFWKEGRNATK